MYFTAYLRINMMMIMVVVFMVRNRMSKTTLKKRRERELLKYCVTVSRFLPYWSFNLLGAQWNNATQ